MRQSANRCPWESRGARQGLSLSVLDEFQLATGEACSHLEVIPCDRLHQNSEGFSFTNITTVKELASLRSHGTLTLVVKGYARKKVQALAFEPGRVVECIVSVRDPLQPCDESRACTLVNMAYDESMYVERAEGQQTIQIDHTSKMTMFCEIRQTDATESDWGVFGSTQAIDTYVHEVIKSVDIEKHVVLHKTMEKPGYIAKKLQVPEDSRDDLYRLSGRSSVQFRPARTAFDPPEENLEILRLPSGPMKMNDAFDKASQANLQGFLGIFCSQQSVFARSHSQHLAKAREFWMPQDARFNAENINMQCKYHYRVQGFPAGVQIDQVHQVLRQAKWNVIVQKVLHITDLSVVFVSADSPPPSPKILTSAATLHIDEAVRRPRGGAQPAVNDHSQASTPHSSQSSTSASSSFPALPKSFRHSPPQSAQGSLMTPIAANMASRVDGLEQKLALVTSELESVKSEQKNTSARLDDIAKNQDRGFTQLMNAIMQLKDESSSPAIPSPPSKIPKLSEKNG
eukprot:s954_g7.t1